MTIKYEVLYVSHRKYSKTIGCKTGVKSWSLIYVYTIMYVLYCHGWTSPTSLLLWRVSTKIYIDHIAIMTYFTTNIFNNLISNGSFNLNLKCVRTI